MKNRIFQINSSWFWRKERHNAWYGIFMRIFQNSIVTKLNWALSNPPFRPDFSPDKPSKTLITPSNAPTKLPTRKHAKKKQSSRGTQENVNPASGTRTWIMQKSEGRIRSASAIEAARLSTKKRTSSLKKDLKPSARGAAARQSHYYSTLIWYKSCRTQHTYIQSIETRCYTWRAGSQ